MYQSSDEGVSWLTTELRERQLRLGADVAAGYAERPGVLGVYLAGSVAAGLGTPGSDVDVMVVLADEAPPFWAADQIRQDGIRVDVEFVSDRRIAELGSLGDPFDLSTLNPRPWWLSDGLDDAIRMLTSVDVRPTDCVLKARGNLLEHQAELRRRVIALHCAVFAQLVEDLWGFAADGDTDSCLMVSLPCAESGLAALLAACGQLYLGRKWIWRKLRRCGAPPDVLQLCRELVGSASGTDGSPAGAEADPPGASGCPAGPADPAELRRLIVGRLNVAQRMLAMALRHGWSERPLDAFPAGALTGRCEPTGQDPWLTPCRMTDGILLIGANGRATRLSEPGLALWSSYDSGLGDERVLASFLAEATTVSDAAARSYLSKLKGAGLIAADRDWLMNAASSS